MKKDLPIYDIKLSDDTQGVGFISLVDEPAIGVDWIKLSKQEPVELFMSLTDNGLCFGCPPNGDGTKANGEPDLRCKGDSAGGGKGGSKGGASKSTANISDKSDAIKKNYETSKSIEDKISNLPLEQLHLVVNGKEVLVTKGDEGSVTLDYKAIYKAAGGYDLSKVTLTHNHPAAKSGLGGSFSPADISVLAKDGFGEIRAVDEKYRYSASFGKTLSQREKNDISRIVNELGNKKISESREKINNGRTAVERNRMRSDFRSEGIHSIWVEFGEKYGKKYNFRYERESR